MCQPLTFAIITVSDTCFEDHKKDKSGPKLLTLLQDAYPDCDLCRSIIPDELNSIKSMLLEFCKKQCNVIFTSGGTGFAPRDVTPEATKQIITKPTPGIDFLILNEGLKSTKQAVLSRAVSGIYEKTLIINLSGSVKAVTEQFNAVKDIIPHAVNLIRDNKDLIILEHDIIQNKQTSKINSESNVKINVANRDRKSPYKMISVDEAHAIILSVVIQDSETEVLNITDVLSRVLAEDVRSFDALPPFPSSIKDGYAVKSSDGAGKRVVRDGVAAGDNPNMEELKSGQCVRISTGAPVPPGADAVVQVEDTKLLNSSEDSTKEIEIEILTPPVEGQDIRRIGSDIEAHSVIMKKGIVLNAAEIGVLAAVGKMKVKVYKRPIVGVISTGNEVQDPNLPLQYGKIRDSNKITILSLLKQYGYEGIDMGLAKDEPNTVKQLLTNAFEKCDIIITTGGVSMGEYDVIKRVLEVDFNARIHFGRVNMKPGKPTTFATCVYNEKIKTIFGLPGNPVSATVTCLLFVIPTLRHCENRNDIFFPKVQVQLHSTPKLDPERPEYQRVHLEYGESIIRAKTTGNQISSRLNSFVGADGLLMLPAAKDISTFNPNIQLEENTDTKVTKNEENVNNEDSDLHNRGTTFTWPESQCKPVEGSFSNPSFGSLIWNKPKPIKESLLMPAPKAIPSSPGNFFTSDNIKLAKPDLSVPTHISEPKKVLKCNTDTSNNLQTHNTVKHGTSKNGKSFNFNLQPYKMYWCYVLNRY